MVMLRIVAVGLVCGVLATCALAPDRVPLQGAPGALRELAGEWSGLYDGLESGRSGSILFRISAEGDSATGDVIMVPRGVARGGSVELAAPPAAAVPLRIGFVQVTQHAVRGELAPYTDPDCGCRLATVFTGTARGDVMDGTFVTILLDTGQRQTGSWRVRRVVR
jgi:hypothetical protein